MRYTQFRAFEKHLQSAAPQNLASVYCLLARCGSERQLAFDTLRKVIEGKIDYKVYSSDPKGERELLSDLETPSLLAPKQLFHLASIEKLSKESMKVLEKAMGRLSRFTTLVLSGESLNRQTTFYKAIEKQGVILEFGEEKPWEKERAMADWLTGKAADAGKSIAPEALQTLVQGVGGNLALLANEWEKLLSYIDARKTISQADVMAICVLTPLDSTWLLGEAILQSQPKKAFEAAHRALEHGHAIFALLRQLRHQFMTALHLASASESDEMHTIAEKFPYLKGAMLEKQLASAVQYGSYRLARAIQWIDFYEFKAKDGWDDPYLLLNLLISQVSR